MIFLGTGAAELYPNPLCGCEQCALLMQSPKYRRKRSAFVIDDTRMLDFGPDVLAAAQQYGRSIAGVRHVFITHAHDDHLSFTNIGVLTMTPREEGDTMIFHMSRAAKGYCEKYFAAAAALEGPDNGFARLMKKGLIAFEEVSPYTDLSIGGYPVRAVHSNHRSCGEGEYALNYLIGLQGGGKLLYVTDSGLYSEENLKYLSNAEASVLIMEGTWGSRPTERGGGHLNAEHFVENVKNMRAHGVITESTRVYVTHINPKHDLTHEGYQAYMDAHAPQKVIVAYDGMEI